MTTRWVIPLILVLALGSCVASWLQFKSVPVDGGQPETVTGLLRVLHGVGRYPAAVMSPDCDGIGPHERRWARGLTEAGYVGYIINHHFTRDSGGDVAPDPVAAHRLLLGTGGIRMIAAFYPICTVPAPCAARP